MSDFLLRRGRFHRGLATPASAFLSTGVTSRPTDGSQRHPLDIQSRVHIAVVFRTTVGARPFPNGHMSVNVCLYLFQLLHALSIAPRIAA